MGNAIWKATTSGDPDIDAHRVLRDVFGVKSPKTVMKRASSILTFFHWWQKHGQQLWPFENDNMSVYTGDFAMDKGFHEGSSFCKHVGLVRP